MNLNISATGMSAAMHREQVRAHNVANVNTPEFKALETHTSELETGGAQVDSVTRSTVAGPLLPQGIIPGADGLVEGSNVDLAHEFTGGIADEAAFKANATALRVQADMIGTTLDLLG